MKPTGESTELLGTDLLAFDGVRVLNEAGAERTYTIDCALVTFDANRKRLNAIGDLKLNGKIRNLVAEAFADQGRGSTSHKGTTVPENWIPFLPVP